MRLFNSMIFQIPWRRDQFSYKIFPLFITFPLQHFKNSVCLQFLVILSSSNWIFVLPCRWSRCQQNANVVFPFGMAGIRTRYASVVGEHPTNVPSAKLCALLFLLIYESCKIYKVKLLGNFVVTAIITTHRILRFILLLRPYELLGVTSRL